MFEDPGFFMLPTQQSLLLTNLGKTAPYSFAFPAWEESRRKKTPAENGLTFRGAVLSLLETYTLDWEERHDREHEHVLIK